MAMSVYNRLTTPAVVPGSQAGRTGLIKEFANQTVLKIIEKYCG